ncbi:MAG: zinc ribbon domain-containing protein [Solirubrobacteraceae bacterium]
MSPIAYFGIESSGLSLAIDLLILFLVVLYGSLVYWTYADARRRIADPVLIGCATLASLILPFVGTIIYMIVRPPEYLEDARERELDLQAAEARLHELDHSLCPHCDYRVERDFIRCPSCLRKLKDRCESCSKPLDRAWTICPYCEAEVKSAKPARRTRREGAAGRSAEPPARSRRKSAEAETEIEPIEPIGTVEEIELEPRPARRRAGAAAVRAPETTSLLSDAPAQEAEQTLSGRQNGTTAEPPAEPPKRRSSRPRASE